MHSLVQAAKLVRFRRRPWDIAKAALQETMRDRIPTEAAAITFFFLLAFFPGLAALVSLYGLFGHRSSVANLAEALHPMLPGGAIEVFKMDLHNLLAKPRSHLNLTFAAGFAFSVWSASGGIGALVSGLNVAYETGDRRSYIKLTLNAFILTVAGIFLGLCVAAFLVVVPTLMQRFPYDSWLSRAFPILIWPIAYFLAALLFSVFYRIGPDRHPKECWVNWGSGIGAAFWILASILFGWYVGQFGTYDRLYGNLGAAVGFLTWVWMSVFILLAGAELNCEIRRTRKKS